MTDHSVFETSLALSLDSAVLVATAAGGSDENAVGVTEGDSDGASDPWHQSNRSPR
jgi:hypothetical protein